MTTPLKRRTELRRLSEDHHSTLVIALRCRRVGDGTGALTFDRLWPHAVEFFTLQIAPHTRVEERLLLPALVELGEHEMADRIRLEHDELRRIISTSRPTPTVLADFGTLLERHVRYEEREVFEATQDRLPQAVLDEIARASAEVPQICPTTLRVL